MPSLQPLQQYPCRLGELSRRKWPHRRSLQRHIAMRCETKQKDYVIKKKTPAHRLSLLGLSKLPEAKVSCPGKACRSCKKPVEAARPACWSLGWEPVGHLAGSLLVTWLRACWSLDWMMSSMLTTMLVIAFNRWSQTLRGPFFAFFEVHAGLVWLLAP